MNTYCTIPVNDMNEAAVMVAKFRCPDGMVRDYVGTIIVNGIYVEAIEVSLPNGKGLYEPYVVIVDCSNVAYLYKDWDIFYSVDYYVRKGWLNTSDKIRISHHNGQWALSLSR